MNNHHQIKAILAGLLLSSAVVPAALADDIEIYTTPGVVTASTNPNILFIVDNSGSMAATSMVKDDYDDSEDYSAYGGKCETDGIYFTDEGETPDCAAGTENWFNRSALECDHAVAGYEADVYDVDGNFVSPGSKITPGQDGPMVLVGTFSDQIAQYNSSTKQWRELKINTSTAATDRDYTVECLEDSGVHGSGSGGNKYIKDGGLGYTSTAPADLTVPHAVWSGGAGNLQLFDGNYLNYLSWVPDAADLVEKTRLEQVQSAVEIMVRGNTRVDIGLMVFDTKSSPAAKAYTGGSVIYPIEDVGADRNNFFSALKTLTPDAGTQLSESYYEALMYYGGKEVTFANFNSPPVVGSATESGGTLYTSPIAGECDKNYIVVLSDGQPTVDDIPVATQSALSSTFDAGSCSKDITDDDYTDDNREADFDTIKDVKAGTVENFRLSEVDNCLDELSNWAYQNDVAEISGKAAHDGEQNIITHTIGFDLVAPAGATAEKIAEIEGARKLLYNTARGAGGEDFYTSNKAGLVDIFNKIIAGALEINTTFSSPAVSVNAFNRSTHLDDLYFTLFEPAMSNHWNGNLKKYKLDFATDPTTKAVTPFIADRFGIDAVDPATGFFDDGATSFWSTAVDGHIVSQGGSASVLTKTRNVVTYTGSYTDTGGVNAPSAAGKILTSTANAVDKTNASLTDALLGTTLKADIVTGTPYRETLLDWAYGLDALGEYGSDPTAARPQMGDPLHAEPALVQYGGDVDDPDLVAYVATNDGYLHGFNVKTGLEEFAFIPQELLTNLPEIMENSRSDKTYGLDGSVAAWINDDLRDGTIAGADDHVYLYFGMRRGGNYIYSVDVTTRGKPELRWVIKGGTGNFTELGETWSTINVEKIKDDATEKTVLIFGGGYDTSQDSTLLRTPDSIGRTVYIVDADTGERLWTAGKDASSPMADMDYSIPARIKPLDISGDGFIDRLYAADTGGQIFRFDINNNNGLALDASITGGRIVDIGGVTAEDNRRFYYPPDVALIDAPEGKYHAVVISSGYRAHPLNETIHDRIYMIKDKNTGLITSSLDYDLITEAKLKDATDNIAGGDGADDAARDAELALIQAAEGWYIDLDDEDNPGDWIGEKGLAEPLVLEGVAVVTTYTPNMSASETACGPNEGLGKVFFLDILDATPAFPSSVDQRGERHVKLVRGGIPPSPNVIITSDGEPTLCIGTECEEADFGLGVRKTYWYEVN